MHLRTHRFLLWIMIPPSGDDTEADFEDVADALSEELLCEEDELAGLFVEAGAL